MLGLAHLRNDHFEVAIKHATEAIEGGDERTINHLIVAIAEAQQGRVHAARAALETARREWPEALRSPGQLRADAPAGRLWIETADELLALEAEAERLIAGN